jgi:2-iminobutanoate/2-iminopropanoate deaminase
MAQTTQKSAVFGANAPVAGAPYSPGVRIGNMLFISGQLGIDPETKQPYADFEQQVEGVLNGLRSLVEAAGGTLENIVKTTVFLTDLGQFGQMNAIYAKHFTGAVKPARSTFQVAALPLGAVVEIEAIAILDE